MKFSNVKNLVKKDISLLSHPTIFLFIILAGLMMLIPEYPRPIGMFYIIIAVMNLFTLDVQTKDHEFSGLLPVQKRESVLARVLSVMLYELAVLVFSIPFAFIGSAISAKTGIVNNAGMNINFTLYAIVLLGYAAYDIIVIPGAYHKQFRVYFRSLIGILAFFALSIGLENLVCRPNDGKLFLNGTSSDELLRQLPFLIGALAIFLLANFIAYLIASRRYEKAEI